jgi:hypothetical protein
MTPQRTIRMGNGAPFDPALCKNFCRSLGTCRSYGVQGPNCELYSSSVAQVQWTSDADGAATSVSYKFYDIGCAL